MDAIESKLSSDQSLLGKKVIVTAGGTKEPLDPVRFLGNNSSGKMGIAMAESAARSGADVTLITTVNYSSSYRNLAVVKVDSALNMLEQIQNRFEKIDVLVMAAAIADFRPLHVATQKIKKTADNDNYTIELTKNPDILKTVAKNKINQFVVGFAAETENLIPNAEKKLKSKNADVILANDVSNLDAGFNVDTNRITLISHNAHPDNWPLMTKQAVADKFWKYYLKQGN
jgi:phosphopantothenoylcysteine decarboxylase/phosphopantothenate--cysteine ligase